MARYFEFDTLATDFRTETVAGLTTFLSMAYILFVNPAVLSLASVPDAAGLGMPRDAVFTATAIAAAFGSLVMGLLARFPIAQAPGMGLNAFFAFSVVLGMGIPWQTALAGTFVSGVVFMALSVSRLREKIIDAIPADLKHAVAAGVGLFIAFIGLTSAGIIVNDDAVLVSLAPLTDPHTLLAIFGLIVTVVLMTLGLTSAIFVGMVATSILGLATGQIALPEHVVGRVPDIGPVAGAAISHLPDVFTPHMLVVVATMLFVDFFDSAGTLMGVARQAGLIRDNKLPRAGRALFADALATTASGLIGTSSTTAYIESASGVAAGGRSGFTAVVVGLLFLAALFFSPLLAVVTEAVTSPALIVVGVLMAASLRHVDWERFEIAVPAFLTALLMPLTYSIATGIAIGFIAYPITMIAAGRRREIHPLMAALAVVFLIYFAFLRL
ncbi:NCS2 family permease [Salinisphaera sp. T31B1]|uniref:NCS2 family permease n=1 Tax=Salinisphaera sp. T31B1 TaxID=727963 RepID=UPI00333E327E